MAEPPAPGTGRAWASPAPAFDAPARYAIRVEGHLSPAWSERLSGLRITPAEASGVPVTDLTGELRDQAALLGVLNALYSLGLPLLAVARLPEADGDQGGAGRTAAADRGAGPTAAPGRPPARGPGASERRRAEGRPAPPRRAEALHLAARRRPSTGGARGTQSTP